MPTPYFGVGDIPEMLRTLGVPVSIGTSSTYGLLDQADAPALDGDDAGGAIARPNAVRILSGSLAGLVTGATIVVDGVSLKVRGYQADEIDGALTKITVVQALR